ncbi:MAG: heme-binding protein [Acetobacterium sp.]|nr:heme-binding protein [Acetobacterium sp.]
MSNYETPEYAIVEKDGELELRAYKSYLTASIEDLKSENTSGFNQIFDYISGNNSRREKIAMTVPVFNDLGPGISITSFVLPAKYASESPPEPGNSRIKIKKIEEKVSASIAFSGSIKKEKLDALETKLLKWLEGKNLKTHGGFRLARYNSPFTPSFLRHNELLIDVEKTVSI